jgi:hypothetical protein
MNQSNSENLQANKVKIFLARRGIMKYGDKINKILKKNIFSNKDFDAYVDLISNQNTIDDFKKYFKFLVLFLRLNNYDTSRIRINNSFVRIFLCAYTIIYFPEVMNIDDKNEVSKKLIENAKGLTLNLKIILMIKLDKKFSFTSLRSLNNFFKKLRLIIKFLMNGRI